MKSRQQIRAEEAERSREIVNSRFAGDSRRQRRALARAVRKRAIESMGGPKEIQRIAELQRQAQEAKDRQ